MFPSSDLAEMRGPAPPAGSAVLKGPVGPAMSLETLLPGVDVPGRCQIVLTVGLLPGVAVPLPAVWDPLFALSPVEGAEGDWCGCRWEEPCCARCLVWSGCCWDLCRGC